MYWIKNIRFIIAYDLIDAGGIVIVCVNEDEDFDCVPYLSRREDWLNCQRFLKILISSSLQMREYCLDQIPKSFPNINKLNTHISTI